MGFLDWINRKIIQPVFRPLFGGKTGSLTPMTTQIAQRATGGKENLAGALDQMLMKGGLVDSLDYALAKAPQAIDEISQKASSAVSKIPVIGNILEAEISKAGGMVKSTLEASKDYKELPKMLDEEYNIAKGAKAILKIAENKAGTVPLVGGILAGEVGKVINTVDEMREKLHGEDKKNQDVAIHENLKEQGALSPTTQ
jgi:hypothetical protein